MTVESLADRLSRPDVYCQQMARDAAANPEAEVVPHLRYATDTTTPPPITFKTVEREDATRLGSPPAAACSQCIYILREPPPQRQKCHVNGRTAKEHNPRPLQAALGAPGATDVRLPDSLHDPGVMARQPP